MPAQRPTIYLFGGCNGSGKSTFAREFVPMEVPSSRFINADEIARGLSPFNTETGAIKAGRLVLSEFRRSVSRGETFAVESTLSGKTYAGLLRQAKERGFRIYLHYFWLPHVRIAIDRVKQRVLEGGHDVPKADIERRFTRSLVHLVNVYAPLADQWAVWDNEANPQKLLAHSATCSAADLRAILRLP